MSVGSQILERLLDDLRGPLYTVRPMQIFGGSPAGGERVLICQRPDREKIEDAISRALADLMRARLAGEPL